MELRSKARRLKSREPNLGLIVVDYLQLMTSGSNAENRVQEVSQISRALKVLARELEVPILAMSQLSRAVEQRQDKRPLLSDLRESGSLEQDSDLVFFVYRDEYYLGEESEQQGIAEIILAKHRNGPTGMVSSHSCVGTRNLLTWQLPEPAARVSRSSRGLVARPVRRLGIPRSLGVEFP
jgi:replicative DNA helicase